MLENKKGLTILFSHIIQYICKLLQLNILSNPLHAMKIKFNYLNFLFLFLTISLYSQSSGSKWTFGLDLASVKYSETDRATIGAGFISQTPRFSLAKYMFSGVTFVGSVSTSVGDDQDYTTLDGIARYDFKTSQNNTVPYIFIGGSFIKALSLTPTLNFGAGSTFWFSDKYGLNIQMMYKFSEERFANQKSHIMPTIGLVYSFKGRNANPRLWDVIR